MNDFVLCIKNDGNPASLIVGKVYRRLSSQRTDPDSMIRITDEDISEVEGYLYPASFFVPVDLPVQARRALFRNKAKSRPS